MIWQRLKDDKSRWNRTDDVIDHWLKERQRVLQSYIAATRLPSMNKASVAPIVNLVEKEGLRELCRLLVDYASVLHFEVLEKLQEAETLMATRQLASDELKTDPPVSLGLNPSLLEKILRTTNAILTFDECCQKALASEENILPSLKIPISQLGEQLATRMDLEDSLINAYMWAKHVTEKPAT